MYASDWGRFLSPDPMGLGAARLTKPKSLNWYSYTEGNPTNYVDRRGLFIGHPPLLVPSAPGPWQAVPPFSTKEHFKIEAPSEDQRGVGEGNNLMFIFMIVSLLFSTFILREDRQMANAFQIKTQDGNKEKMTSFTEIINAIRDDDLESIRDILTKTDMINAQDKYGWSPLFHSVKYRKIEITKYLLAKGADPNLRSEGGITPIFLAASEGNKSLVKLLLGYGADPSVTDSILGDSPLHRAAADSKDIEVVKMLINSGAKINIRNKRGITPLMRSCYISQITQILINNGASVNEQDEEGKTALFYMSLGRCNRSVQILMNNNADPFIRNKEGQSTWDIAKMREDPYLSKILSRKTHAKSSAK